MILSDACVVESIYTRSATNSNILVKDWHRPELSFNKEATLDSRKPRNDS